MRGTFENAILIDFLKPRIFKREIQKYDRNKTYLVYCAVGRVVNLLVNLWQN